MFKFKEKLQVVETTKGTMRRLVASAQDLQATVDEQSEQVQLQCEQIHPTVQKLDDFTKRLRKNISKYDTLATRSLKWSPCCLRPLHTQRGVKTFFSEASEDLAEDSIVRARFA